MFCSKLLAFAEPCSSFWSSPSTSFCRNYSSWVAKFKLAWSKPDYCSPASRFFFLIEICLSSLIAESISPASSYWSVPSALCPVNTLISRFIDPLLVISFVWVWVWLILLERWNALPCLLCYRIRVSGFGLSWLVFNKWGVGWNPKFFWLFNLLRGDIAISYGYILG